jgi:hypothetical protein
VTEWKGILRGVAAVTRKEYLRCARAFAAHYRLSPADLGAEEVRDYLLHLTRDLHYSPANLKMHVAALKFLYGVTLGRPAIVDRIPYPKVPRTLGPAQFRWVAGRKERLLPTDYFHLVFTLPATLRPLVRRYRRLLFDLLFATAADTLLTFGRHPKRLGAEIGFTLVLHTWTRDLRFHPHLHAIVTGGGLDIDADRWVSARQDYLFPVQALSRLLRGKFLHALMRIARTAGVVTEHPLSGPPRSGPHGSFARPRLRARPGHHEHQEGQAELGELGDQAVVVDDAQSTPVGAAVAVRHSAPPLPEGKRRAVSGTAIRSS